MATHHAGRWTLEDRFASPWHYLPVEVPAGACALRVELEYERSSAVMDLGCFGGRLCGWSGGARRTFVITTGAATPGYLSGELEAGTWHVVSACTACRRAAPSTRSPPTSRITGELEPDPAPERMPPLSDRPGRACSPRRRGAAGWRATCIPTPCIPTAR